MKKLLLLVLMGSAAMIAAGQDPTPQPVIDATYTCTAPGMLPFSMHYKKAPDSIQTEINQQRPFSDLAIPVISGVSYSGGASVLTNLVKINPTANGVPLTVTASDAGTGIQSASLFVDGDLVTTTGEKDGLPAVFYLRWNARTVGPGTHFFRLVVWDGSGNLAEKAWSMDR